MVIEVRCHQTAARVCTALISPTVTAVPTVTAAAAAGRTIGLAATAAAAGAAARVHSCADLKAAAIAAEATCTGGSWQHLVDLYTDNTAGVKDDILNASLEESESHTVVPEQHLPPSATPVASPVHKTCAAQTHNTLQDDTLVVGLAAGCLQEITRSTM
jgi:hypothetical protein